VAVYHRNVTLGTTSFRDNVMENMKHVYFIQIKEYYIYFRANIGTNSNISAADPWLRSSSKSALSDFK